MKHKVLAVIPARGGSKRIPKKNLCCIDGKPLVALAIEQAQQSGIFDKILVSSDDEQIGNVANLWAGEEVWWHRPAHLAQDDTPMLPVVLDAFEGNPAEVVMLLQPTSPFRSSEDIKNAYELLTRNKADSVISVYQGSDIVTFQRRWAGRLQTLPEVVHENGAIYGITSEALNKGETFYSGFVYGYEMSKDNSLDIDTAQDLDIAKILYNRKLAA